MFKFLGTLLLPLLMLSTASAHDICRLKYTLMHYAKSQCYEVETPLSKNDPSPISLRTVLVTEDLADAHLRPTVIFVPGGPGESAEPLKTMMQSREMLNGIWHSLKANVVLYDPRGTGMSPLPGPTQSYGKDVLSSAMMVEDLKKVVDTVSPNRPVIIVAHSAGGHTALKFAEKYGDRTASLLLLSASQSPRQMAQLNLALFSDESFHFQRLLQVLKGRSDLDVIRKKHDWVEEVLKQQLKARILGKFVEKKMKPITPMEFREALVRRLSLDPTGALALNLIESFYNDLEGLGNEALIPIELSELRLKESDMHQRAFSEKEWIQIQIMCGEGITESELDTPVYYDGLTMRRFCADIHIAENQSFDEPDFSKIKIPVVSLSGSRDSKVPPYIAEQIVDQLPNATLMVEKDAGHMFVDEAPMTFFNAIEKLIQLQR